MSENVNGLTTAALTDGEFLGKEVKAMDKKDESGSIQLTQDLEARAQALLKTLDAEDVELEKKWAQVAEKLDALEKKYSS